jgi:Mg/Co/Ni transporter MgtE
MEHARLVRLIRWFLDAKDEVCAGHLLDDVRPDDLARLISDLDLDQRAIVIRLLASRRDGTSPVSP